MKLLKRIITCITAGMVAASCIICTAAAKSNFQYSGETLAKALKSTVVKISYECEAEISYKPVTLNVQEIVSDISELKSKNPDVNMQTIYQSVYDNIANYAYYSNETKNIKASAVWSGSGVVISEDGYIATNQHVIEASDEERTSAYISSSSSSILEDLSLFINQIMTIFGSDAMTDEAVEDWYRVFMAAYNAKANILSESDPVIQVCFPNADGETDSESAVIEEAEIVAEGEIFTDNGDTEDVAILKIDKDNLAALTIMNDYPEVNSQITAAGFPGASSELFDQLSQTGNSSDELAVTITNGTVARIVPIDNSEYEMIQSTATIEHGNSGGPSINNNLEIVGLNTLKSTDYNGYYWMVPAEAIEDRSSDINLKNDGKASVLLKEGLQALQNGKGRRALNAFEELKELQPDTPYINVLISEAGALPQNMSVYDLLNEKTLLIVGAVFVLASLLLIIMLIAKKSKKKPVPVPMWDENLLDDGSGSTLDITSGSGGLDFNNDIHNNLF